MDTTSNEPRPAAAASTVVVRPIGDLEPAGYNPRVELRPDDPEYQQLKASIETFGLVEPLVFNTRTGRVVGGHQRLTVIRDLGIAEVPVVEVDLDDDQERALNVALNKIDGRWDDGKLLSLVDQLRDAEWDLVTFGFSDDEYDDLLRRIDQAHSTDFLDDLIDGEEEDLDDIDVNVPGYDQAWFTMSFSVSNDERQRILDAINVAKERFDLETSAQALVRIADEYTGKSPTTIESTAPEEQA